MHDADIDCAFAPIPLPCDHQRSFFHEDCVLTTAVNDAPIAMRQLQNWVGVSASQWIMAFPDSSNDRQLKHGRQRESKSDELVPPIV
jgi:hypothetical protein